MPLLNGTSHDIINENVKELRRTGKYSQSQCVAIAMKHSRKGMGKKMERVAKAVAKSDPLKVKSGS